MHEKKLDVLEGAIENVCGDRHKDYGDSLVNHTRIANLWNTWITGREWSGKPLTAYDVAMMMGLVKVARCMNRPKLDSHIDIAGYAAVAEDIYEKIMEADNGGTTEPTSSNDGTE
jgi:hypothetical protein|tara:strand:- start:1062 stop:1406 length:345 start_codon:yes stop_codon:yes gene_type:complete